MLTIMSALCPLHSAWHVVSAQQKFVSECRWMLAVFRIAIVITENKNLEGMKFFSSTLLYFQLQLLEFYFYELILLQ